MIIWRDHLHEALSLADALERDAQQLGAGLFASAQAWLARREAARLRRSMEPRVTTPVIAAAPSLNPDGTDSSGRIVDHCRFMAFHARKGRKLQRAAQ